MAPKLLERKSHVCVVSASDREMASLADYFSRVVYYVAASFRSMESDKTVKRPIGYGETRKKHPLESNRQTQEDKENVQVSPHVSADGEELVNVKSIRCQYTIKQKQRVVLYHGVRPTELRKALAFHEELSHTIAFTHLQSIQWWLKSFCDASHTYL